MLRTPAEVIARASVLTRPEYEDVSPITDAPGFYAFRRYPPDTPLGSVITTDGRPAVRCYLAFIVLLPEAGSNISSVVMKAWYARRWIDGLPFGRADTPPPGHPDGPNPASSIILARTPKPLNLDSEEDLPGYIYDNTENRFFDEHGNEVTPLGMLEEMYQKHLRTLGTAFRVGWGMGTIAHKLRHHAVWKSQDGAMWILLTCYDVEVIEEKKGTLRNPLRLYKPRDFQRISDPKGERSHFFGFQTSRRSFVMNLAWVAAVYLLLYFKFPHTEFLRVIYHNTALSTAALVFAFLLADTVVPWLLIMTICGLSRRRDRSLVFTRKVRV